MSSDKHFLDERGMGDLARKSIQILRLDGASPTELRRLETLLKEGNVGEAFIMSSLLRTILGEISPEASQKKLLIVYRTLEDICQSLVEFSRNLFDIEAWQHYRDSGYESFEAYCTGVLGIPASKVHGLRLIKDQPLPRPRKAGLTEFFAWFFNAIEILAAAKSGREQ
jgi:hypothetical protein